MLKWSKGRFKGLKNKLMPIVRATVYIWGKA